MGGKIGAAVGVVVSVIIVFAVIIPNRPRGSGYMDPLARIALIVMVVVLGALGAWIGDLIERGVRSAGGRGSRL